MVYSILWLDLDESGTRRPSPQDLLRRWLLTLVLLASTLPAAAQPDSPIPTANRSAFLQPVGLPDSKGAAILSPGEFIWRSAIDIANTSIYQPSLCDDSCILALDGETMRLAIGARRGFGSGWEAGLTVPLIHHGGGFLDPVIEGWHDAFGLPNGNRDEYPADRLRYSYKPAAGGTIVSERATGLGDLQLTAGRRLGEHFALRSALKLPTGKATELTGSGGSDLALSLHFSSVGNGANTLQTQTRIYAHLSAGAVASEDGDLLSANRERWLLFGSATIGWQAAERWHLKMQIDAHSAAWDSPLEHLGEPSAQLVVGATAVLDRDWFLDLAFSEDLVVERSPDIVFQVGLSWRGI